MAVDRAVGRGRMPVTGGRRPPRCVVRPPAPSPGRPGRPDRVEPASGRRRPAGPDQVGVGQAHRVGVRDGPGGKHGGRHRAEAGEQCSLPAPRTRARTPWRPGRRSSPRSTDAAPSRRASAAGVHQAASGESAAGVGPLVRPTSRGTLAGTSAGRPSDGGKQDQRLAPVETGGGERGHVAVPPVLAQAGAPVPERLDRIVGVPVARVAANSGRPGVGTPSSSAAERRGPGRPAAVATAGNTRRRAEAAAVRPGGPHVGGVGERPGIGQRPPARSGGS